LQLTISQSVLALSPSVTLEQILADVRQLRGWYYGASSLTGGLTCLICSTLWSLLYSTLYWNHHLTFWSLLYSTLYWNHHLTLWSLLCSTIYWNLHHLTLWSLLVWVWVTCTWLSQSVSQSVSRTVRLDLEPLPICVCLHVNVVPVQTWTSR